MRYWKVIVLIVVIVFSFGTYYVQNALAKGNNPNIELETVSGDKEVVKEIVLLASLIEHDKAYYENVRITDEDILYRSELSYFDLLNGGTFHNPTEIRLQDDYRDFMRGKGGSTSTLFENEKHLVYVGPYGIDQEDDSFEIEILDKDSANTTSFKVVIPEKNYQYMNIVDVQVMEDKLSVITRNYQHPNKLETGEEFHVYHISLENQSLINHNLLYETKADYSTRKWTHISEVNSYRDIGQQEIFVFRLDHIDESQVEYGEPSLQGSEYFAYHYKTGELVKLEIPEELGSSGNNAYVSGMMVYFLNTKENELKIVGYSIEKEETKTIEIPTTIEVYEMNTHAALDGEKMYIPSSSDEGNHLFVVDLGTGNLVYEGKIITDMDPESGYFDIYDVAFE